MGVAPARPRGVAATDWGWRHQGRKRWAVDGVTLRIQPGERVLLLGASGSGKSTLLAGMAGILGGDEEGESRGTLSVAGVPPQQVRHEIGLVLQDPESQVILQRIGDDVAFAMENAGIPREEIWRRVSPALDAVGLGALPLDASSSALSGGQKQRLVLAGALAMRPGLLLLDEPTANLDPAGARDVVAAVQSLVSGRNHTLVVVEHRVDVWLDVVDRVIVLDHGSVFGDYPVADFRQLVSAGGRVRDELDQAGVWLPGRIPPVQLSAMRPGYTVLSARELCVARERGHTVYGPVDMPVAAAEAWAITGPNGVGKSTLALTLAGLLPEASGEVYASEALRAGISTSRPIRWTSHQLITRVGSVFQNPEHQFVAGSVAAEIAAGPRALGLGHAEIETIVAGLAGRLRLTHLLRANPYTLSGGEKRRLSVATVLATAPQVLILDEPTFGQDANTWRELVELMGGIRDEGKAIIVVTHDRALVEVFASRELQLVPGLSATEVVAS